MLNLVIDANVDLSIRDSLGRPPLHFASCMGDLAVVAALVARGHALENDARSDVRALLPEAAHVCDVPGRI